jgi:hypothetical protein
LPLRAREPSLLATEGLTCHPDPSWEPRILDTVVAVVVCPCVEVYGALGVATDEMCYSQGEGRELSL